MIFVYKTFNFHKIVKFVNKLNRIKISFIASLFLLIKSQINGNNLINNLVD